MVENAFAKWATGFSGCDGGNPGGSTWICGIEYGGGETEGKFQFTDVTEPAYVGGEIYDRGDFLKYRYNWKAVKLLAALDGRDVKNYAKFYEDRQCFNRQSDYFKLNLFPLGFRNTSHSHWTEWIATKTGIPTKDEYLRWCIAHRFPALRSWVEKYSPKLVVCTGITYADWFHEAFGEEDDRIIDTTAGGKLVRSFVTNGGKTLIAVTYFFGGRYGLKSDPELAATAKHIAELTKKRN